MQEIEIISSYLYPLVATVSMGPSIPPKHPIKILIVDDSWVLRRVLRGTLSQTDAIMIVGEAGNGVEALEMILSLSPDVILLDMEMPIMDGMTTLQHLMIHTPTPTIMLSSLSSNGSARCFDALKYGAVDFVSKSCFFQGLDGAAHSKLVLSKVFGAAATTVHSINPMQPRMIPKALGMVREKIIFCEECGSRQILLDWPPKEEQLRCTLCGDEISLLLDKPYRRMNFVTVIGAGKGGYANLLQVIPALNQEMGGALCVLIRDEAGHVESFANYLDAICDLNVTLGKEGLSLEGGCCYLFSQEQQVLLSPYSGSYSFRIRAVKTAKSSLIIDELMVSAASLLRGRVAGVLLSGATGDGTKGMDSIAKGGGNCFVLNPDHCLHKTMVSGDFAHQGLPSDLDEAGLAAAIQECHSANKDNVITA